MSVILDPAAVEPAGARLVAVTGTDLEHLLVRWLGEVLFLYDGLRFAAAGFRVTLRGTTELSASVAGEPFDPARHPTRLDVKAVTYHQIAVREEASGGWTIRVFLDI
jgi:SHS2 domain-containing protein